MVQYWWDCSQSHSTSNWWCPVLEFRGDSSLELWYGILVIFWIFQTNHVPMVEFWQDCSQSHSTSNWWCPALEFRGDSSLELWYGILVIFWIFAKCFQTNHVPMVGFWLDCSQSYSTTNWWCPALEFRGDSCLEQAYGILLFFWILTKYFQTNHVPMVRFWQDCS